MYTSDYVSCLLPILQWVVVASTASLKWWGYRKLFEYLLPLFARKYISSRKRASATTSVLTEIILWDRWICAEVCYITSTIYLFWALIQVEENVCVVLKRGFIKRPKLKHIFTKILLCGWQQNELQPDTIFNCYNFGDHLYTNYR